MTAELLLLTLLVVGSPTEDVVADELERAMAVLSEQEETPHYVAVTVTDIENVYIWAETDTLMSSRRYPERVLDVDVRVGTPELDSTHPMRGSSSRWRARSRRPREIPMGSDDALRHALWREIDARYRDAAEAIVMVRANQTVKVEEEDPADDFGPRDPRVDAVETPLLDVDPAAWEATLTELAAILDSSEAVHRSSAKLEASSKRFTFVDTEGSRLSHGRVLYRLSVQVTTTAEDGDRVSVFRYRDVHDPANLPDAAEMRQWARDTVSELEALLDAPRGQPYSGPVLLRGRAAGVFVHEVLGHRLEGHRQKRDNEGKTFKEYLGEPILPAFVDIVDDPTLPRAAGEDLSGTYAYDDEGVPAQRVELVDDGVLVGFLMGRSPIEGFPDSNGHGRRSSGRAPVSRMGNLVIETSEPVPFDELREMLLEEVRRQDAPYGVIVDEIAGGFTMTGRFFPNSFNVRANSSWRVYPDGRPDELIRGIDLVGTPLEAFANILAAGDDPDVFNGYCGAESGSIPVSSVSPSLLFSSLEFQLKYKGSDRPPLLDKPSTSKEDELAALGASAGEGRTP